MSKIIPLEPCKPWELLSTFMSLYSEVRRSYICKRQVGELLEAIWKHELLCSRNIAAVLLEVTKHYPIYEVKAMHVCFQGWEKSGVFPTLK